MGRELSLVEKKIKVLQVAAVDLTVKFLLLPLIDGLIKEGFEVHIVCSPGKYSDELKELGYVIHPVKIPRRIAPLSNFVSFLALLRLMHRERYQIVHVHTPVAAALGRLAAKIARIPVVIYTAHGFYFHDLMPWWKRRPILWIEKALGKCCTDFIFTQSAEDRETAVKEKIKLPDKVIWIGNGVDPKRFETPCAEGLRSELGLRSNDKVVGFIGRLVREKGVEELFQAVGRVKKVFPETKLLVVGDTLESERDRRATKILRQIMEAEGLVDTVIFAGFREDIPELLSLMDVFVLPSHREGMPRTVLEAMAAAKPVIATDIRGCREEVIDGVTGFLIPIRSPEALAEAIIKILSDAELAHKMGQAGRKRVIEEFDEKIIINRQLEIYRRFRGCPGSERCGTVREGVK